MVVLVRKSRAVLVVLDRSEGRQNSWSMMAEVIATDYDRLPWGF